MRPVAWHMFHRTAAWEARLRRRFGQRAEVERTSGHIYRWRVVR